MLTFCGVAGFRVVKLNVAGKAKISFSERRNVCGMVNFSYVLLSCLAKRNPFNYISIPIYLKT